MEKIVVEKLLTSFLNPRTLAKIILVSFAIRILGLVFAEPSYQPIVPRVINIMIALLFATYFLLILHHKSINITMLNILMTIFLMMATLLMTAVFLGNFIIASIGYGLWFSSADIVWFSGTNAFLIYYVMAFVFFLLLSIMMIGVTKKFRYNYAVLQSAALVIVIACLAVSLYQNLTIAKHPIMFLSNLAMGVGYVGMALFIGSYGKAIKKNKETKNAQSKQSR